MAKHFRSTLDIGGSQHVTIASVAIAASGYAEISTTKDTRLHTLFAPMCISITADERVARRLDPEVESDNFLQCRVSITILRRLRSDKLI